MNYISIICLISLTWLNISCSFQKENEDFEKFLLNFKELNFPFDPRNVRISETYEERISADEFGDLKKFLKVKESSFWRYDKMFEYYFIGKRKTENYWMVVYNRNYLPDDMREEIVEYVLTTFSFAGEMISELPITGGYNDSLVFEAVLENEKEFEVKYSFYTRTESKEYSKYYAISDSGIINQIK